MIADSTKNHLRLPRSLCISLVAFAFILSQATVYAVDDVSNLWKGSALLGFAYGCLFGLFPTITIEWFGLRAYSPFFRPKTPFSDVEAHKNYNSTLLGELGLRLTCAHDRR